MSDRVYVKQRIEHVSFEAILNTSFELEDTYDLQGESFSDWHSQEILDCLTPRQRQVVTLLAEGYTRAEVMAKLGLSDRINFHRLIVRARRQVEVYLRLTKER